MPRRCLCTLLRQRIATDARLATLPMAAKWLWLSLAERAAETLDASVPMGSAFGFFAGIAMLIQVAEPEVETHWETLVARGLVQRQGDAVLVPDLPASGARQASARANGGLGGRPRRGETPEAARLRRAQGHMMLPVAGGADPPPAKPTETQPANPSVSPTSSSSNTSLNSTAGEKPARDLTFATLGAEIASLAGLDPVRQRFDYQPVKAWLADGMTPHFIRTVIAEVAAKPSFNPARVNTLAYFTPALHRARAEDTPAPQATPYQPMSEQGQAILAWIARGGDWADRPVFHKAA